MNKDYDIKISPYFTGALHYLKEDYLTDTIYHYSFRYRRGKLQYVAIYIDGTLNEENPIDIRGTKFPEVSRFNEEFWLKAPRFLHFDDCRWERELIMTDLDIVTSRPLETVQMCP